MARYRPRCPIIAVTRDRRVARLVTHKHICIYTDYILFFLLLQCHLHRGIHPLYYPHPKDTQNWTDDMEKRFDCAIAWAKEKGYVQKGSSIIVLSGWRPGPANTNTIRIFPVD